MKINSISNNFDLFVQNRTANPKKQVCNSVPFDEKPCGTKKFPKVGLNYFVSFGKSFYNPKSDRQLQNIRNEYKNEGTKINFSSAATKTEREITEGFFTGKYDNEEDFEIQKVLGSNAATYVVSKGGEKVVIKCQHKQSDGSYNDMKTKIDSPDFDDESKNLEKVKSRNIHSTKLLADITTEVNYDPCPTRKIIAISFVDGKRLTDSEIDNIPFLNKKNLEIFYDDLLKLDSEGFYHRDLNAYNVLGSQKDKNLYIIDYGSGKTFKELQQKADTAKELCREKSKRAFYEQDKTFEDEDILLKNIKYRKFDGLEYSNLENFEAFALFPYLKKHLDKEQSKLSGTAENQNQFNQTDKLFLEHLNLSSKYHGKKAELLKKKNYSNVPDELRKKQIHNEKVLAQALKYINPENPDELTKDIADVELLRIKMLHSQKAARLYVGNDDKNYKMALYWNMELGVVSKFAGHKIDELEKKYAQTSNTIIREYLDLNKQIAQFYNTEIFPEVYTSVSNAALKAMTSPTNKEISSIESSMFDGCWLDSTKRAPSNYIPDTPHKYGLFQF